MATILNRVLNRFKVYNCMVENFRKLNVRRGLRIAVGGARKKTMGVGLI